MKKRLLILSIFLLIAFIGWSQVDSTKYWVTYPQLQEMYRIMLEGDECQEDNTTLLELVAFNDSLAQANIEARENLKTQLDTRTLQYENEQVKYQQAEEKFDIADEAYKGELRRKNIYKGTTIAAVIAFLVSLFI